MLSLGVARSVRDTIVWGAQRVLHSVRRHVWGGRKRQPWGAQREEACVRREG